MHAEGSRFKSNRWGCTEGRREKAVQQVEEAEGGAERKTDLKERCKGGVPHGFCNMEG